MPQDDQGQHELEEEKEEVETRLLGAKGNSILVFLLNGLAMSWMNWFLVLNAMISGKLYLNELLVKTFPDFLIFFLSFYPLIHFESIYKAEKKHRCSLKST